MGQQKTDGYANAHQGYQGPVTQNGPTGMCARSPYSVEHQGKGNNEQDSSGVNDPGIGHQCPPDNSRRCAVPGKQLRKNLPAREAARRQEVLACAQCALCDSSDQHKIRRRPGSVFKAERPGRGGNETACHNTQERNGAERCSAP